jgi:hypothetical protein
MTEPFYTHCFFHFHQLQKEIHASRGQSSDHGRKSSRHHYQQQQQQQHGQRPYKTSVVQSSARRRSASPLPQRLESQTAPAVATVKEVRESRFDAKPPQATPVSPTTLGTPSVVAQLEHDNDGSKPERRILKRKDASVSQTANSGQQQQQQPHQYPFNPHVIVEYECGACKARNVVTREVRFLQTFVPHNGDDTDAVSTAATANAAATTSLSTKTTTSVAQSFRADAAKINHLYCEDDKRMELDRETDAILNCKNNEDTSDDTDACHFQINISNVK